MSDRFSAVPRWLKITLAVSLVINFLIIGFGVGAAWRFHGARDGINSRLQQFVSQLEEPKRTRVRAVVREKMATFRRYRRETRQARRDVLEILRAGTYDAAALDAAKQRAFEAFKRSHNARIDLVPAIASELSAQERIVFADNLERLILRRRWRKRRD
ncbi:MAG: periplasmic heavy metal sensor [Pseudomonadota bacterium]